MGSKESCTGKRDGFEIGFVSSVGGSKEGEIGGRRIA